MVVTACTFCDKPHRVSVLALSSRFDGLMLVSLALLLITCFSTRSVESF